MTGCKFEEFTDTTARLAAAQPVIARLLDSFRGWLICGYACLCRAKPEAAILGKNSPVADYQCRTLPAAPFRARRLPSSS